MARVASSILAAHFLSLLAPPAWAQVQWKDFRWIDSVRGPLRVEAGRMLATEGGAHLFFDQGVHLAGEDLDVRAEWMEVWTRIDKVVMAGSVRVIDKTAVVLCDRLELDRRASRALLTRATFFYKRGVTQRQLAVCKTATGLRSAGINAIRLVGDRWVRRDGKYLVERARLTSCDCGPDEAPSWEISAHEADVVPDERAWLNRPVLHIKGLPVLALPVAYMPLGERRSGLLMPRFNYSGLDGMVLGESLFVTLGDHADTTLSLDWIQERGVRQRLELRAIPVRRSWLAIRLSHIDDAKARRESEKDPPRRAARHRESAELDAWWDGPDRTALRTEMRLYSDSDVKIDFLSGMSGRAADYALSGMSFSWRSADQLIDLDAAWRQDLRLRMVELFGVADSAQRRLWGLDPIGDTIQRLGAVSYHLAPVSLFGWPLQAALFVEGANLSSLQAAWRDWGPDGVPNPREQSYANKPPSGDYGADDGEGGEGDGELGSGELRRAFRLLVEPELRWATQLDRFAGLEARLAHRQLVYQPHGPQAPRASTRGISFASLSLASELSRAFSIGAGGRMGHVVGFHLGLAGAWRTMETSGVLHHLDLQDRLTRDAVQMRLGIESGLFRGAGRNGFARFLDIRLEQGLDLRAGRVAQLSARLGLDLFPVRSRVAAVWAWREQRLAEVDGSLALTDRRGDRLRMSYLYLSSEPDALGRPLPLSERTQRELGLLFGTDPSPLRGLGDGVHVMEVDATLSLVWGFRLGGGLNLNLRGDEPINWWRAGLAYRSDCRCWGVSVLVLMPRGQDVPDFFFVLDLGMLGRASATTADTRI